MLTSVDPWTGEELARYEPMTASELERALAGAAGRAHAWRTTPVHERALALAGVAAGLRRERDALAALMAAEMGKPIRQGRAEVDKCASGCEHYAEHGPAMLVDVSAAIPEARAYVSYRPLGVILAVMPWNFPLWQVFRFAAPAVVAGNTIVLKHSSNVTGCALAIQRLFDDAGAAAGILTTLRLTSAGVADVIADPRIAGVTLTGSTEAGRAVAAQAGLHLKKTVLELGGSDPYLILADADLDVAARVCVDGRTMNSGQSCIAAKRWVVVRAVADEFIGRVREGMLAKRVGDPRDETTEVGPLARRDLRDQLAAQVQASRGAGARVLVGGEVPAGPAAIYPPTVLTDVAPGMPAYDEELFGPVASVIVAEDERDAIRIANDSPFGLGAAVFTRDLERGEEIARDQLEAGCCFVNALVRSDPRLPFGGIKQSGYGRELGQVGIHEFCNIKTVWVDRGGAPMR